MHTHFPLESAGASAGQSVVGVGSGSGVGSGFGSDKVLTAASLWISLYDLYVAITL